MIDRNRLALDEQEVWDETFPDGFWGGSPHRDGPHLRLWSYGYICMLELGRIPEPVTEVLRDDPNIAEMLAELIRLRRAARRIGE